MARGHGEHLAAFKKQSLVSPFFIKNKSNSQKRKCLIFINSSKLNTISCHLEMSGAIERSEKYNKRNRLSDIVYTFKK